jgi:glycosyltransferase involved in cell wall biosynthesis
VATRLWILDHAEIAGGGQRFALRVGRHAAARPGLEVRVVCPADSVLAGWCREAGLAVMNADFPPFHPAAVLRIGAALRNSGALMRAADAGTLLLANSARVQAYLFAVSALARTQARVVNVMHEQDSARRPSARFAYRRFGTLLVVGEAAAAAYRQRLPGVMVHEANNFLLESELTPLEALRRDRHAPARPAVLGVLGRMIPEKGLLELVEELAADAVRPRWRRLVLAAFPQDQSYERRLRARIQELGIGGVVELVGPRAAAEVLAEVDALIVPSTGHEAQPTVIIEALAAGVPVIVRSSVWSSAYEGLPVVGYDSEAALATALEQLPGPPASPRVIAKRFGPEQFMAALGAAPGTGASPLA